MASNEPLVARWALLPLRLVVGFGFVAHGMAKLGRGPAGFGRLLHQIGVPVPLASAWAVTLLEILGGLALLAGAFVAVASVPLLCSMLVAMVTIHWRYGFSAINTTGLTPQGPTFGPPGYEVNLLYIGALLALIVAGAGPLSVDGWIARRRRPRGDAVGRPRR
ncbi:MAG TPA: DoxX family protein [Gemmatimonadaceae bacterium]|jgi:putative oxidoreductase|nr:DoxX family protein [Gemmatimonadaceae bacterium]